MTNSVHLKLFYMETRKKFDDWDIDLMAESTLRY